LEFQQQQTLKKVSLYLSAWFKSRKEQVFSSLFFSVSPLQQLLSLFYQLPAALKLLSLPILCKQRRRSSPSFFVSSATQRRSKNQQLFPFNEAVEISLFFVSVSTKSSPLPLSLSQPSSGFNPLIQQKKEVSLSTLPLCAFVCSRYKTKDKKQERKKRVEEEKIS
jgi:hypothetical protein